MNKRILLFLAIAGATLFWSALIAEISFRYIDVASSDDSIFTSWDADEESETSPPSETRESFLVLFVLVALAVMSTSYLTYQIAKRNQLTHQTGNSATTHRQTKRQVQGNKTSFKTSRERTVQKKNPNLSKNRKAPSSGQGERASSGATTEVGSATPQATGSSGKRIKGRVRVYYTRRSYGFVEDESKQTVFFHKSAIGPDIKERDLTKKPNVSYVVTPSDRGPIATEIQLEQ